MKIRALRKASVLLLVDVVIIIGIFVLQFRTDSNIIEKLGNLQLTFLKNEESEVLSISNFLRMSFNGINIYFDDQNPVKANKDNVEIPLTLKNYKKTDNLSYSLYFSEDVILNVALSSEDSNAQLLLQPNFPSSISHLVIPYNFSTNIKIQKESDNQIVLEGKKSLWEVTASSTQNNLLAFEHSMSIARYGMYTESQKFSLDILVDLPGADSAVFASNVQKFKNNIISSYNPTSQESSSEQVIAAYVAAMAENGDYTKALEAIPQSFKKGKQRTYFTAPFLNTLEEMNDTLDAAVAEYEKKLTSSMLSSSLDIFMIRNIAPFMYIHSTPQSVIKLLDFAAATDVSTLSLAQVTGILEVYVDLLSLDSGYARHLEPVLEDCIQKITDCCIYENGVLTISENDTFLSVIQGVETGMAVLRYGRASNNDVLEKAGYVMVNSYLSDSTFDIRTSANLYSVIAYDSPYYPGFKKIGTVLGNKVWAWTCAKDITYTLSSDNSELIFTIDFPLEWTHYVIIKGVPKFAKIFIYDMQFRTDPRFETYNSSGYVYKASTKTLLLKSRHKKQLETIRLEIEKERPVSAVPATAAPAAATASPVTPAVTPASEKPAAETGSENGVENSPEDSESSAAEETTSTRTYYYPSNVPMEGRYRVDVGGNEENN
ncbi:MAG: hypothetical protein PUC37_13300 [Spirochaetales bacterium]|nr:hypothetical protein [Spirochaetales bacterium]